MTVAAAVPVGGRSPQERPSRVPASWSCLVTYFGDAGDADTAELMRFAARRARVAIRESGRVPVWTYPIAGPEGITVRALTVPSGPPARSPIPPRPKGGRTRHWAHLAEAATAARSHASLVPGLVECPTEGCWHVAGDKGGMCRPCREAEKRRSASEGRAGVHLRKD